MIKAHAIYLTIATTIACILLAICAWNTRTVECGMCGAHVHDYWVVRNMDNTAWVDVCSKCYDLVADGE